MKNTKLGLLVMGLITTGVFAFSMPQGGSIKGRVNPSDVPGTVWAVSGSDTLKAAIYNGSFNLSAKPGSYKVVIDVADPYKDVVKESVQVASGTATDLGDIKLEK